MSLPKAAAPRGSTLRRSASHPSARRCSALRQPARRHLRPAALALPLALAAAVPLAGCDAATVRRSSSGTLQVVAAENFWGSIAAQLGGRHVAVRSVIVNPDTDPHEYEPTPADARAFARAQMTIVNGIGYDEWASRLLSASPVSGRADLDVGDLLGLKSGANPHQWYSPAHVRRVVAAIANDYQRLRPRYASYFRARRRWFESVALHRYDALVGRIRRRFAAVPVGYSESVFAPLGQALHLKLLTPYSFAKAVAEGSEVTASDLEAVDRQVQRREIAVWVFNSENVTPVIRHVNALARAAHIPIATVTETLSPASDTFEQWQVGELERLQRALQAARGR